VRLLVTGHLGYIGSVLVPELLGRGHEVHGVDTDLYRRCGFGPPPPQVPTSRRDIRDLKPEDLEGFDAVLHLAGLSNDPLGDLDPALTMEINYRATVRLAHMAREAGVRRFLFSSTCSVYGAVGEEMVDESSPVRPVTPYAESKVRAEEELLALRTEGFLPVILRSATAYGVSHRLRFDLVLNNLVAWAHATGDILIKSDGTPWRPVVHIRDIAQAFAVLTEAPAERFQEIVFNVGRTTENYRVRELAEIVAETVPGCRISYAPGGGPDKRCYRVNCDRIQRTFPEFQPSWTARRGARELHEAFRERGVRVEDFEGDRFQRIAHIRFLMGSGLLDRKLRWARDEDVDAA
jgi:nucleoside-diphosphate-sugar epimerase